jgi:hypothetical protein
VIVAKKVKKLVFVQKCSLWTTILLVCWYLVGLSLQQDSFSALLSTSFIMFTPPSSSHGWCDPEQFTPASNALRE